MTDAAQSLKQLVEKFLGRQMYVIHTVPKASREEIERLLPEHLQHQVRLEKDGIMFAAGPMANEDGSPPAASSSFAPRTSPRRARLPIPIRSTRQACAATRCAAGPSTRGAMASASPIPTRA